MTPERDPDDRTLKFESAGLTLLGVVLNTGVTVAVGIKAAWWIRLLCGLGTVLALLVFFGCLARPGKGPISRFARWVTRV